MMPSPRLNTHKLIARVGRAWFPVALGACLLLLQIPMPPAVSSVVYGIAKPMATIRDRISTAIHGVGLVGVNTAGLVRENEHLQQELSALRRELVLVDVLREENARLRTLRSSAGEGGLLSASILHVQRTGGYGTAIVDIGALDGVRERMLVRSTQGFGLGIVTYVEDHAALVTLFSSASVHTSAVLSLPDGSVLPVNLEGRGSDTFVSEVPRDLAVQAGTMVMVPEFTMAPIGTVVSVERTQEGAYQTLFVRALVNVTRERFVLVDTTARSGEGAVLQEVPPMMATTTPSTQP